VELEKWCLVDESNAMQKVEGTRMVELLCLGDEKMIVHSTKKDEGTWDSPVHLEPGTSTRTVTVQYYPVHVHTHVHF
jgi:hypothetical protein